MKFTKRVVKGMTYRIKNLFVKEKSPDFYNIRHTKVYASTKWKSNTNDRLLDLILAAVPVARTISHRDIAEKMKAPPYWPEIWPGEKYKLLSAIVAVLKPRLIIEIGTSTGLSALSMKKFLPPDGRVVTFDLRPWNSIPNSVLLPSDFEDGALVQINENLGDKIIFQKHADLLRQASIVFIDVGNDELRREEKLFLENFQTLSFINKPIFIMNDIRLDGMVDIWQNLDRPKLDVSSFGHWSGNGLVDWQP